MTLLCFIESASLVVIFRKYVAKILLLYGTYEIPTVKFYDYVIFTKPLASNKIESSPGFAGVAVTV